MNIKSDNGSDVEDRAKILLGKDFCEAIRFDFTNYLHTNRDAFDNMGMGQSTSEYVSTQAP